MKKILIALLIAATITTAYAGTKIPLGGASLPVNGKATISFSKLMPNVWYSVNCTLVTTGETIMHFNSDLTSPKAFATYLTVNGKRTNDYSIVTPGLNAHVDAGNNELAVTSILGGLNKNFVITNLDDTVTGEVTNCYAFPE